MKKNKNQELKVAMLGHKKIPSRLGGIEIVVEELASRMVKQGIKVTCYNRNDKDTDNNNIKEYKGIRIKKAFTINKKGMAAVTSSFFASIKCAFGNYDVVHYHAEGPCVFMWIPKLFGKKCVATIHGLDHKRAKWGKFASWYIKKGEKNAVKYADEIIVLSNNVKNYFQDKYNRHTVFISNGVNKVERKKADLITDKFGLKYEEYILFLARLVPEKGVRYLIEAYKSVNTEKKLVIAGGASDTDDFANELKKLAEDDKRIIFTGFVQGQILEELYSNCYLYTLPSNLEGMPLSLLEAMSYGRCCIISDIEECTSVAENHAIVFRKSDIEDLKEKIQYACDNPDVVHEYSSNSADFICKKYNWDEVTNNTVDIYRQLCR